MAAARGAATAGTASATPRIVALSGGVGGAKLAHGLARVLPEDALMIVANTGDDFVHLGLSVCPDLDSILYALGGLSDPVRGWGRKDESWQFMEELRRFGGPQWFALGDRDLALHVWRSERLRQGATLSQLTGELLAALDLRQQLIPMADTPVRTHLDTDAGWLEFQQYFVQRRCEPRVRALRYDGAASAQVPPAAVALFAAGDAPDAVIICPSNPYLSIDPILAIPGWRDWLRGLHCPIVAVSPIVAGDALKGCAAKIMREFELPVNPVSIARHYAGLIDLLCIDVQDAPLAPQIEALGTHCVCAPTVMRSDADREALARTVLAAAAAHRQPSQRQQSSRA